MFEKKYKELMNEVTPDAALVEKMAEQSVSRKRIVLPKVMKVTAAVLCGLVVLAGGTVAVDAATDGAVRKLFGLKDSVAIGGDVVNFSQNAPSEKGEQEWMAGMTRGQNGEVLVEISSTEDEPVFYWYYELGSGYHQFAHAFQNCTSEEEYAWSLYERLNGIFADEYKKGTAYHEKFLSELVKCKEQIGTETEFERACAQGIQWFIDDLKAGRNVVAED